MLGRKMTTNLDKSIYNISHTKLSTFRRCLQQFHWKYIDHYYPKSSVGQIRGSAGHAALAEWHRTKDVNKSLEEAWKKWSSEGLKEDDEWLLLQDILSRYFLWSLENDTFTIVQSEFEFKLEFENAAMPIILTGFIDGIVEEDGRIWLLENKFHKRASASNLSLDPQVSIYMLGALLNEIPAQGVIYNIVRVGDTKIAKTEPAIRSRLYHSSSGLARVSQEVYLQAIAMIKYEKEGGIPYRNPTKDCSWDCPFYTACLSMQDDGIESKSLLENACDTGD